MNDKYCKEPKIEFYKAFLKAQSEFPDMPKNKSGARGFKYSDLGEIFKLVIPILHKNGICIEQDIVSNERDQHLVCTRLTHADSGQSSESFTLIPYSEEDFKNKISFQVYGTGYTYFKRYALASKLCLYTDEDTDGYVAEKSNTYSKPRSYKPSIEPPDNLF